MKNEKNLYPLHYSDKDSAIFISIIHSCNEEKLLEF